MPRRPTTRLAAVSSRPICTRTGTLGNLLYVDGAVGRPDKPGHLVMNGREVFRHAVTKLADAVDEALAANGFAHADVDWLVPHQANRRIIDAMGRKLGLAPERVIVTVDRHANTSAASIPLALAEARADGRIRPGHLVLLEALGGGLTWGSGPDQGLGFSGFAAASSLCLTQAMQVS